MSCWIVGAGGLGREVADAWTASGAVVAGCTVVVGVPARSRHAPHPDV
ncbi:hypothetical protein [Iamia sp.]|nr:hypothetical protein [Iamia sp.]HXH57968.1 hypothetical protein [Iamia sp.]